MSGAADIVELKDERVKRAPLKDAGFEHAGAMLKAAREAAGHSIEDVSDAINVRTDYLEAIEDMNTAYLPIAAYTVGFVKAYGQFLELPVEPLVARFRKEAGYEVSHIAPEVNIKAPAQLNGGRELSLIAILLIVGFVIWVGWQITKPAGEAEPVQVERTPLQQRATASPAVEDAEVLSAGAATAQSEGSDTVANEAASQGDVSELPDEAVQTPAAQLPAGEGETQVATSDNEQSDTDLTGAAATSETPTEPSVESREDTTSSSGTTTAAQSRETSAPVREPAETRTASEFSTPESEPERAQPAQSDFATPSVPSSFVAASVISQVSPVYPQRCERRAGEMERVRIGYDVNARGRVVNERILESTNSCFDSAALRAISRWRFEPATRNGQPAIMYDQSASFGFRRP